MKNITVSSLFKPIGRAFARFHMTIFIVFIVGGLAAAVLLLDGILNDTSNDSGYTSPIDAGTIDQTTLNRIKQLHTSDDPAPTMTLPAGRTNPFAE
jgi:hypothetical protein